MTYSALLFIVGIFLIFLGGFSGLYLFRSSILKEKELKDINVANLWVLFLLGITFGLILCSFWFE